MGFALLLFVVPSTSAQDRYCVDDIKDLKLASLPGKIVTYYSPGQQARATELKQFLERAAHFLEDSLKVEINFTMATLAPKEWNSLLDRPYGLPTVRPGACKRGPSSLTEPRYAAIMPAALNGPVYDAWIALKDSLSPSALQKLNSAGLTFEQGGKVLLDFVGLHELGHVYANAFGIKYYVNVFAALMADYLAYAWLRSTNERLDKQVISVLLGNIDGITPVHSSFTRYEGFRSSEHPPTEAWYNSMITLKAAEIYEQRGFEFLHAGRNAFTEAEGKLNTETIIARLETIHPGILNWTQNISHSVRKQQ